MKRTSLQFLSFWILIVTNGLAQEKEKPNLLWITAEDMSPTLGCYGDKFATTPHLDKFATQSVRYTHAFAASPVCSPSRSCLITGMYPVSMGTHQMRSGFPLPEGVKGFPAYLREAGYFCTNNVKTDYNNGDAERLTKESWNESSPTAHWRTKSRREAQPFFAVFNDMTSHQSRTMVWPHESFKKHVQSKLKPDQIHDPKKVPLPPYFPDTPEVRRTMARYYDCVTVMDQNVGRILAELEADGLAENTIVFFYSDHGSGLPRHKRLLHDSGMKVALMVRFPEKWKHLAPVANGKTSDQLVSFVDFPATVLAITGLKTPGYMQGVPFIGGGTAKRSYIYGSRDRVDEVFETARSLRNKRYLYIRNYTPHLSYNQPSVFSDLGEIRESINGLASTPANLTEAQIHYLGHTKAAEEFYDCEADPHNVTNLLKTKVIAAEHKTALDEFRRAYTTTRFHLKDVGALPEEDQWKWIRDEGKPIRDVLLRKTKRRPNLLATWAAADMVGTGTPPELLKLTYSVDPIRRYWGIIGLRNCGKLNAGFKKRAAERLEDSSPAVKIEAASWLAQDDEGEFKKRALTILIEQLKNQDWWIALRACRAIELLGPKAPEAKDAMREVYDRTRKKKGDENLFLAFSAGAFLQKLGEPTLPWDFSPEAGEFNSRK